MQLGHEEGVAEFKQGWNNTLSGSMSYGEIKNILDEYVHPIHIQAKREKNNDMIYCVY